MILSSKRPSSGSMTEAFQQQSQQNVLLYIKFSNSCSWSGCENVSVVESSWNVMAHGDALEGKWRGNWRIEWVASTLHTTSKHGVSSITTSDAHTSAAISRLNWRPCRFKWTRPFRRKTKSGFCACAITFKMPSTSCRWTFGCRNVLEWHSVVRWCS